MGFPDGSLGKESACNAGGMGDETQVQSLNWEDLLEEDMATHASIPAWEIPWWRTTVQRVSKCWTQLSTSTIDQPSRHIN